MLFATLDADFTETTRLLDVFASTARLTSSTLESALSREAVATAALVGATDQLGSHAAVVANGAQQMAASLTHLDRVRAGGAAALLRALGACDGLPQAVTQVMQPVSTPRQERLALAVDGGAVRATDTRVPQMLLARLAALQPFLVQVDRLAGLLTDEQRALAATAAGVALQQAMGSIASARNEASADQQKLLEVQNQLSKARQQLASARAAEQQTRVQLADTQSQLERAQREVGGAAANANAAQAWLSVATTDYTAGLRRRDRDIVGRDQAYRDFQSAADYYNNVLPRQCSGVILAARRVGYYPTLVALSAQFDAFQADLNDVDAWLGRKATEVDAARAATDTANARLSAWRSTAAGLTSQVNDLANALPQIQADEARLSALIANLESTMNALAQALSRAVTTVQALDKTIGDAAAGTVETIPKIEREAQQLGAALQQITAQLTPLASDIGKLYGQYATSLADRSGSFSRQVYPEAMRWLQDDFVTGMTHALEQNGQAALASLVQLDQLLVSAEQTFVHELSSIIDRLVASISDIPNELERQGRKALTTAADKLVDVALSTAVQAISAGVASSSACSSILPELKMADVGLRAVLFLLDQADPGGGNAQ